MLSKRAPKPVDSKQVDPLDALLLRAAAATDDPAVKRWLTALRTHGERAEASDRPPTATT